MALREIINYKICPTTVSVNYTVIIPIGPTRRPAVKFSNDITRPVRMNKAITVDDKEQNKTTIHILSEYTDV